MSEEKIFNSKPISFFTSKNIPISFIIHVKDQFSNTASILQSIFNSKNPFDINLVNDNSRNDEYFNELNSNFKFLKLFKNNLSYIDAFNEGLDMCENSWILYINASFVPHNLMWLNSLVNSMLSLKHNNVKMISPIINNFNFFNLYKNIKEDLILSDHFLPLNVIFFHRDLFKVIGKLEPSDNLIESSRLLFERMAKRNFKQAICPSSIFTA